jgi:beta-hydroxylase
MLTTTTAKQPGRLHISANCKGETMNASPAPFFPRQLRRTSKKAAKRLIPLAIAVYFVPFQFTAFVGLGLLDFARNKRRTLGSLDRYFAGNGLWTWLLCPLNLLLDLLSLPYWNKGVYQLKDLPKRYQDEIKAMIEATHRRDLVAMLSSRVEEHRRGMIFFKWYGKNIQTPFDVPEFHREYKFIRTIGVSVFNKKQSTGKHFGPLRATLRVLYNINQIESPDVYIQVGNRVNRWRENKLFIFDDTLQHKSCNESDEVRYCMFIDILRPSLFPRLMSAVLACIRMVIARSNRSFYGHWTFIK